MVHYKQSEFGEWRFVLIRLYVAVAVITQDGISFKVVGLTSVLGFVLFFIAE